MLFKPSSKNFTDRSKAVLLLWIIHVISGVCLFCFHVRLSLVALWSPAWKGLISWLSFVMSYCEFVTFSFLYIQTLPNNCSHIEDVYLLFCAHMKLFYFIFRSVEQRDIITSTPSLHYSYVICVRRFGSFFGVQNFKFQYFWGFQKNEKKLGYEDFVDIFFGGHHKFGLYLGVISMHFRVFS